MSIFAVLSRIPNPKLEARIVKEFPNNHYKLSPTQWLISSGGTSIDLSQKIGIVENEKRGETAPALVLSVSNYYGSETPDLWEWLKVKMEQNSG
jgi:hypothetical protein